MTRVNHFYERLKRGIAFLLAVILTVQPFFRLDIGFISAFAAENQGRSSSFAYYDSSNLLKPGASFPFYGKNHNRVGLWPYGLTNVEGSKSAPGYCLEPNKSMRTGTGGTLVTYDLDLDGDNLPLGLTREEAEILWYALSSSGNFEGYQSNVGKVRQGHYILGQCATWAIMSGNWAGLDDFRNQMEVLMANLKSPTLAAQTRGALEQFFNQTNGAVEEGAVPPFASKYKSTAPVHEMTQNDDGTYTITLKYSEGFDWRQSTLVYDLPEGWSFTREADGVTFICTTGNPDIGLVKGHFEEGSGGAKYWVRPNTFKIWYPDGWTEGSAVEGKQAMITMAGEQQTWEVWLSFGKGDTHTETGNGSFEISYTQYLHEETFKRDYKIELEKRCDETGKPLQDSTFEILEQFDFSQLDGTNLEADQFHRNVSTSEGGFETLSVCQSEITTDGNGHFEHSDQKTYNYSKTYCGGHPEPVIEPAEMSDEASEEEQEEIDGKNEQLEQDAWAAWQECVDWCEQNCDFHSIDEGAAREDMEADRNQAWDTFIHLKRIYTVREIQARKGYILHDLHNDDLPIEIVEFMSSQVEGDGEITGHYPGNQNNENGRNGAGLLETLKIPRISRSLKERKLVQAAMDFSEAGLAEKNETEAAEKREEAERESQVEEIEIDKTKAAESKSEETKAAQREKQQESDEKPGETEENKEVQKDSQSGEQRLEKEEQQKGESDKAESKESEDEKEETIKESETEVNPTKAKEESSQTQSEKPDESRDFHEKSLEEPEELEEQEEPEGEAEDERDMEVDNNLTFATGSNAEIEFDLATPSNAVPSFFAVNRLMRISDEDDEGGESSGGSWEWDGVQEESEVSPIDQSSYPSDYTGYSYVVKDHRTEGELHINKRDMELYEQEGEDSYGKSQADATLEGAVYGLYAAEDIIHPDGKTGKVFSSGELVSIAATDKNGDASFVVITETSETSKNVPNLYSGNVEKNGNGWIGRPLLLGSYYVEEISRSEGYELSRTGRNLAESNRTGKPVVLAESGSAHTEGFFHRINEWEGNSYDFMVDYFNTKGFNVFLSGLPEGVTVYEVTEKEGTKTEQVATGSSRVEKRDSAGNIIYQTAKGGEYKLDGDGNKIIKKDSQGNVVYSDKPFMETVTAVNRLNRYVSAIEREAPSDMGLEESGAVNQDYIMQEVSSALLNSGYKGGLTDGPWSLLKLSGQTNGERIEEILQYCASDSFWDAYEVDEIVQKGGNWYARVRYGYKGIINRNAIYDKETGRLVIRREYEDGYYYAVYEADEYERDGYQFTVEKKKLDREALEAGEFRLKTVYSPVYETYGAGEFILDLQGQKVPVMETVPQYTTQETLTYEEILTPVKVTYDRDKKSFVVHVDTAGETFGTENSRKTFRVVVDGEIGRYREAAVNVSTKKEALDEGSYVKYAVLLYPGQLRVYEDSDTRKRPIIVLERVIKQAIKVTKDIALDSYENNTYEIHRDPFTVLFGGYNGKQETKTLPGFYFKLYLRSDLEGTGKLKETEDGSYDYERFFKENPAFASDLALEWDMEKYDVDGDMTTVHARRGGGSDDYWGQSRMLPYGAYVLVEQQPTVIPQKAYAIDSPKEVEIPFIPQVDQDGTVHDKVPDPEYLYDSKLTPEQLTERYHIRFNEESHIIYAHNHDGDFEVFKYGLEPDSVRDCQNETVAAYYHYGSVSEDAGLKDGVYYETYYDRDGKITDYGVTLNGVDTMTGKSTAVDRKFAKALIPWSVLDPRYGEVINDNGDVGNREPGYESNGGFNFVSFSNTDFENELYSSRLRIEKLDSETGENILHDGALFKIYAAKRDIRGDGADGVTGSGDILFDENGVPLYDESEQIFMQDSTGAEVGIFKAYSTVRDGEVTRPDGSVHTEKQTVGYLETYKPLGAGAYVLVEVEAPAGYVKSRPIAFTVYSDKVEYYEEGDKDKKVQAVKYQYMRPVGADGKTVAEDMHQIVVKDAPTKIEIHKVEKKQDSLTYRVEGTEEQLKARGDVELQFRPNGEFAGFGFVTKRLEQKENPYVANATLTLYEGLEVKQTGEHAYEGVKVTRNLFDSVTDITAYETGVDQDIRKTGMDKNKREEWDITQEKNPPVKLWRVDLDYDPTELDAETGILYGLDDWGNRLCMVDSETGMAYVTDQNGAVIVWPLDENGDKIISQSVEVFTDENGKQTINTDLKPVVDENGLPIYYQDGGVIWLENEWVTPENGAYEIARVKQGAYILEETAAPLADGYVQSVAMGLIVRDTGELQSFTMEDDYTKLEVSKLDMTSREEIAGATLILYEAYRVYDDSDRGWHLEILRDMDGKEIAAETWVSEGGKPHWIDHIMPGDYILRETRVPTEAGYVTSEDMEVIILETGEVQGFVMEDDHTAVEVLKVDAVTGKAMDKEHRAELALYPAVLNEAGEPLYDETGKIRYDRENLVYKWQTDDGSEVRKTAHSVTVPGGHSYTAYDYDVKPIPGTKQAVCYVTETGALRFEYLPVGKYVLVEEKAPVGYLLADPVYVPVLDVGSKERVQSFTMEDKPIKVLLTKVNVAGGKELAGATVSVYRAAEDGSIPKEQMTDKAGNLLFVTDTDGNLLRDDKGELIPAVEYDEDYLMERWISGSDGRYTKNDLEEGRIPEGYEIGDLRPHELQNPVAGSYYFVEEQTPFGYVRAVELPFAIVDTMELQKFELVDELVMGQLEIIKSDEKKPEERLEGARFKFTNLDTNVSVILITDEQGRAVSSEVPVGAVGEDGTVSLYHFSVQEVKAPEGYLLDTTIHRFQFNVNTDRYHRLTYEYQALDAPSKVIVSKKALTTKEELPGASLEVRSVTETSGEDGETVRIEGDVVEAWISTDTPHEIEYLTPGEYVLIETRAPEGYLVAEKVYFTVKENMTVEEIPFVEMFDDDTRTEIVKADSETKEPLAGAKLQLISGLDGQVIREWMTDKTGTMEFLGLPAGDYLVKELEVPEGYQLPTEPFKLTVVKDYKVQTFTLENKKIEVLVEKRDMETREFVSGAVLELRNEQGEKVAGWTTGEKPEKILGLVPGKYVLTEVKTPEGYLVLSKPQEIVVTNTSGVQTFVVVNQTLEVDVVKKDKESGNLLTGAGMRLVRNSDQAVIREWVSGQTPEVFKGLAPGSYTLEERKAPGGYAVAKSLTFEVTETEAKKEVVMEDERITVDFQKTDGVSGEPLAGAVLQLVERAGTEDETVIREWISGKEPERFVGIHAGTYIIREKKAPAGFVPMKELVVEIRADEAMQTVVIRNQPIQAEIGKSDGDTGKLLGGATLQLVRNRDGKVIREWVSREGQAESFKGLESGRYTVRELKAPSGYRKMEPQEIEVRETKEVQEFTVKNYKIRHSGGGGGGDRPKPEGEYMELYKVDGATGERLAGATITVYKLDGSIYFEGVTGTSGTVRFKKPVSGSYVFKETKAPEGYYLNGNVYQFVVGTDGKAAGEDTVPNYKKTTVIISKEDVTTSEELPGAEIEITDRDGKEIFKGTSDENGKVYFEVPAPGEYHFREVVAPDGYELNETVFTFTVFDDGRIMGDCTITDRKHYGRITASYETERKGDGDMTVGELLHAPKTGDTSGLAGLFVIWLASVAGLVGMVLWRRRRKKEDDGTPPGGGGVSGGLGRRWKETKKNQGKACGKHDKKAGERNNGRLCEADGSAGESIGNLGKPWEFVRRSGALLLAVFLATGIPAFTVRADSNTEGELLENLYEEHQYVTENPDSDEAQKLFEKEIERDGTAYRLSEIRTEVVKEEQGGSGEESVELASSPFLESMAEKHKPEETYEKDGVIYHLRDSRLEKMAIPAHEVPVTEEVVYEAVEALDRIPSKISVTITDEGTGQEMESIAAADRQESGEERWEDTFSFPVTFHEYGLEGYWIGDKVFKLEGDVPDFTGYEKELLTLIGASEEDYKVESVSWDGEAYEDAAGVRCRNAVAKGKKLVRDCTVTYTGSAVFLKEPGVRYVSTYVKEGDLEAGATQYTMKAVGVYVPKKGNGAVMAAVIGITSVGAGAGTARYVHYRRKRQGNMV